MEEDENKTQQTLPADKDGCRYSPLAIYQRQVSTLSNRAAYAVLAGLLIWLLLFGINGFFLLLLLLFLATLVAVGIVGFERERLSKASSIINASSAGMEFLLTASYYENPPFYLLAWNELKAASIKSSAAGKKELRLAYESGEWSKEKKKHLKCFGKSSPKSQEICLDLNAMPVRARRSLIAALRRWAPPSLLPAHELHKLDQTGRTDNFTELWIDSLKISGPRRAASQLQPGASLSDRRYEIVRVVGSGGQGTAYEALDRWSDPQQGEEPRVILKEFIMPVHGDEETSLISLKAVEKEAKILQSVACESVVKLYDSFVEDYRAYLVIEFIEGLSLAELVEKNGALKPHEAASIAMQMCDILTKLHNSKPPIIHRDFTPDNLILGKDGRLKLIDFDVAHTEDSPHGNQVVGKPKYLAPEQFQGRASRASDIYSLGASLHYLLCAQEPTPIQSSHPRQVNSSLPEELDAIVAKATAVKSEERYGSAQELKQALSKTAKS